jgi:GT2 family glycosyltransferase
MPSLLVGIVYSVEPVEQLERCLRAIEKQIPSLEKHGVTVSGLLVKTPQSGQKFPTRFFGDIHESESENLAINRNLILERKTADWIYFTDPDCVLAESSLEKLVIEALCLQESRSIFAIAGPNVCQSPSKDLSQAFKWLGSSLWLHGGATQVIAGNHDFLTRHSPTCNILYLTKKISSTKFSPEFSLVGEDLDFNFRLSRGGSRIFFVSKATVFHEQSPLLSKYLAKVFGYGRAQSHLLRKDIKNAFNPRLFLLYGAFGVLFLFLFAPRLAVWVMSLTAVFGLLVFFFEYVRFKEPKNFFYFLWFLISIYVTYLLGQCFGLWPQTLAPRNAEPKTARI